MGKQMSVNNRGQIIFGTIIIVMGLFFLVDNLVNIDIGAFFWPLLLIGLGIWLLARPRTTGPDTAVTQRFLSEDDRSGEWMVADEEFQTFISDLTLDLTKAEIPQGETRFRFLHFVGDIELLVPESVGVRIRSSAFVSSVNLNGHKEDHFLSPVDWQSDNYKLAEQQIYVDANGFVNDVTIRHI